MKTLCLVAVKQKETEGKRKIEISILPFHFTKFFLKKNHKLSIARLLDWVNLSVQFPRNNSPFGSQETNEKKRAKFSTLPPNATIWLRWVELFTFQKPKQNKTKEFKILKQNKKVKISNLFLSLSTIFSATK